jgi:hypothetical protein
MQPLCIACNHWLMLIVQSTFCPFSFGHFIVYPFSIYCFWLFLWYLQTCIAILRYVGFQEFMNRDTFKLKHLVTTYQPWIETRQKWWFHMIYNISLFLFTRSSLYTSISVSMTTWCLLEGMGIWTNIIVSSCHLIMFLDIYLWPWVLSVILLYVLSVFTWP